MPIQLNGSTSGSVQLDVPAAVSGGDVSLTLPNGVGSANQFLKNNGTAGTLEFASLTGSNMPSGSVVQVVQTAAYGVYERSYSNGDNVSMGSEFEVSFTPVSRSNKFLIETNWYVSGNSQLNVGWIIREDSSGTNTKIRKVDGTNQWKNSSGTAYWNSNNDWPDVMFAYGTGFFNVSGSTNQEIFHNINTKFLTKLGTTTGSGDVTWSFMLLGGESSPLYINRMNTTTTGYYWSYPATSTTTVTEIAA